MLARASVETRVLGMALSMEESVVTWEKPPRGDDPSVPTREQIAAELNANPGVWGIVARHDRVARATAQVERIESGREYGAGYQALHRRIANEHRVYARKVK